MQPSCSSLDRHRATTLLQVDDGISSISGMVLTQLLTIDYIRENGYLTNQTSIFTGKQLQLGELLEISVELNLLLQSILNLNLSDVKLQKFLMSLHKKEKDLKR
ncbi:unnamed protein product [Urochloa humidicola]